MSNIDIAVADKDQLVKFAKDEYQVVIDPRTKIETIRARVEQLVSGVVPTENVVGTEKKDTTSVRYVKSKVNDLVYEWHAGLADCEWLVPCDADGNVV